MCPRHMWGWKARRCAENATLVLRALNRVWEKNKQTKIMLWVFVRQAEGADSEHINENWPVKKLMQ